MKMICVALLPFVLCLPAPAADSEPAPAVIRATGVGKPPPGKTGPQARLMARRAAEVVALRNLAARLHGQPPATPADGLNTTTTSFIRGHHFLPPRTLPDGCVEVTVELPLAQLYTNHSDVADRLARVEAELAATRAELDRVREQARRNGARLRARLLALEQELSELHSLLDELSDPPIAEDAAPQDVAGTSPD